MSNNEIVLEKDNKILTKYGTTTKDIKPKVLYIRSKAKITPTEVKTSFETDIILIKEKFLEYINKQIKKNKHFDDNYIANIDISSKSVSFGKVSFLRYEVYLKPYKRKTFLENKKIFEEFSFKLDNKLNKLLTKCNISCV